MPVVQLGARFAEHFQYRIHADVITYCGIVAVLYALEFSRQLKERSVLASQLETQLTQAQLKALKMQLHPHFLFNTLHSVSGLILDGRHNTAISTISRLSDLLRNALKNGDQHIVPLREELRVTNEYLQIEALRFADRVAITTDVDPETLEAGVPNLILQPLIENAFRHGVESDEKCNRIELSSHRNDRDLIITIRNTGGRLSDDWTLAGSTGIGIHNTLERLEKLYGANNWRFEIRNHPEGGVLVTLVLPFETANRKHVV